MLDQHFAGELPGHEVITVPQMAWAGTKNSALLRLAEPLFDAFITVDRNLAFQQDVSNLRIAVLVLRAPTNRFADLKPLAPEILKLLPSLKPGQVTVV